MVANDLPLLHFDAHIQHRLQLGCELQGLLRARACEDIDYEETIIKQRGFLFILTQDLTCDVV